MYGPSAFTKSFLPEQLFHAGVGRTNGRKSADKDFRRSSLVVCPGSSASAVSSGLPPGTLAGPRARWAEARLAVARSAGAAERQENLSVRHIYHLRREERWPFPPALASLGAPTRASCKRPGSKALSRSKSRMELQSVLRLSSLLSLFQYL